MPKHFFPLFFPALAQDCGGNWKRNEDFCYLASSSGTSWYDARKKCQKEQADLVIITDSALNVSYLSQLDLLKKKKGFWNLFDFKRKL